MTMNSENQKIEEEGKKNSKVKLVFSTIIILICSYFVFSNIECRNCEYYSFNGPYGGIWITIDDHQIIFLQFLLTLNPILYLVFSTLTNIKYTKVLFWGSIIWCVFCLGGGVYYIFPSLTL